MKTIWDKYHYDRQIIDEFLASFEIKLGGQDTTINWKNTLSKILVWDGFNMDLKYDYTSLIEKRRMGGIKPLTKLFLNYIRPEPKRLDSELPLSIQQCEILFFLKNKGETEVILPILKKLNDKIKLGIVYENDDTQATYPPFEFVKFNELSLQPSPMAFGLKKTPNQKTWFVLNAFLNEQKMIEKYLTFFTKLKQGNEDLKKVLFVAGENKYMASLCCEWLKDTTIKVENLMNGAKYGWPNDADVDFDTWYVWNNKMKTFLNQNAGIKVDKLKVIGHPLEDQTKNHSYSGNNKELGAFRKNCKLIITLFTTSLKFDKKLPIYEMIIEFVKKQPSIGLIIKAHQSDKDIAIFNEHKTDAQILYFDGFSKNLLLDIISTSQLTISFGSTVSFESVWMGVPNISYEEEDDTLLPIEDELFYHINKIEDILPKIQTLLNNDIPKKQNTSQISVVDKYVECILDSPTTKEEVKGDTSTNFRMNL